MRESGLRDVGNREEFQGFRQKSKICIVARSAVDEQEEDGTKGDQSGDHDHEGRQ